MVHMFKILSLFYRFIWRITKVSKSFSSDGEDLIIEKIFHGINKGTYVDIGAYAPISYNNTFLLYLKGWNGVLIDPRPRFRFWAKLFRSKDEVFNIGIDPNLNDQLLTKKLYVYDNVR